jgi:hypothetical protein
MSWKELTDGSFRETRRCEEHAVSNLKFFSICSSFGVGLLFLAVLTLRH